jgi:RecA-family ATPase
MIKNYQSQDHRKGGSTTSVDKPPSLRLLDLTTAFGTPPPPIDFVFPGLIAGTVGALVSAGGTGKSFLALQLAASIAAGCDLTGLGWVAPGSAARKATYFPAEDPEIALRHRLYPLGQRIASQCARDLVVENLRVYSVSSGPNLLQQQWSDEIRRKAEGSRLVVFDTLRRFHFADENASGDMAMVLSGLEMIAEDSGAAVLFLHHTRKDSALNGQGGEQQASRGSSVLVDNVRWQANLTGMTEKEAINHCIPNNERHLYVRLTLPKINYSAKPVDEWLIRTSSGLLERWDNREIKVVTSRSSKRNCKYE